jgi:hypothetical protein
VCGGEQAVLGVDDPLGGVEPGAGDEVDAGAVAATQRSRFGDRIIHAEPNGGTRSQRGGSDPVHRRVHVLERDTRGPSLPFGLSPHMPDLPGRPGGLHHAEHPGRGRRDEPVGDLLCRFPFSDRD